MSASPQAKVSRLWVVVSMRAPRQDGDAVHYEALSISNDPTCALREARARAGEVDADGLRVIQVPAVGFREDAFEGDGDPALVQVVYRFEGSGADGRVRAEGSVVAVAPSEAVAAAFIAGRPDASEKVVYFGWACPLRLSWMH